LGSEDSPTTSAGCAVCHETVDERGAADIGELQSLLAHTDHVLDIVGAVLATMVPRRQYQPDRMPGRLDWQGPRLRRGPVVRRNAAARRWVIGMQLLLAGVTFVVRGVAVGPHALRDAARTVALMGVLWLIVGYALSCSAFAAAGAMIAVACGSNVIALRQ
jgi:hypothetical protein